MFEFLIGFLTGVAGDRLYEAMTYDADVEAFRAERRIEKAKAKAAEKAEAKAEAEAEAKAEAARQAALELYKLQLELGLVGEEPTVRSSIGKTIRRGRKAQVN